MSIAVIREASPLTLEFSPTVQVRVGHLQKVQMLVSFVKGESEGCAIVAQYQVGGIDIWYLNSVPDYIWDNEFEKLRLQDVAGICKHISESINTIIEFRIPLNVEFMRLKVQARESVVGTSLSIIAMDVVPVSEEE